MITKNKDSAEKAIREIRRATRRQYSAEAKIRIVLEDLRGESSIAELCRTEGINQNLILPQTIKERRRLCYRQKARLTENLMSRNSSIKRTLGQADVPCRRAPGEN